MRNTELYIRQLQNVYGPTQMSVLTQSDVMNEFLTSTTSEPPHPRIATPDLDRHLSAANHSMLAEGSSGGGGNSNGFKHRPGRNEKPDNKK